jgi:hypothetical protein
MTLDPINLSKVVGLAILLMLLAIGVVVFVDLVVGKYP